MQSRGAESKATARRLEALKEEKMKLGSPAGSKGSPVPS